MNKNRLYLFLVLIFSSLVLFAWDVAANRNFIKLMLPQTQRSSSIVASNGESNSDTKPGGITKDCLLPSFVALPNMGVDTAPSSSVVADFNNDGKLDVITANSIANNISRLFGNDIGNLTSQIQIPVGLQPTALAALDFNQDGNQDLVVANRLSQTVTLLLGDGTGNFNSRNNIFLGSLEPISIRVGDFNNDGRLDIASANTNNSISVLTNVDGESLNPTIVLNTGQLPNSLEVADLDHDGNLDIVIGKSDSEELTIFVGDGTGSFTSKNILAGCGVAPKINGVGDFNHDGLIDLLVNGNTNRVLFGDNNGQFNKAIDIVKGSISTFGDFNNDSNLDVLVFVGDKNFSLVLSDGKGRAKTTTNFSIDVDLVNGLLSTGDFNKDGKLDFLVTDKNNNLVTLVLNTCKQVASCTLGLIPTGGPLPDATAGTPYSFTLDASGGTGPYIFTLLGGSSLPAGIGLSSNGKILGTPSETGLFGFKVQATDTTDSDCIAEGSYTLSVTACILDLNPSSGSLKEATAGTPYSFTLNSSGNPPISFSVVSGALPTGLSLSPSGVISGTASETGNSAFKVEAESADSICTGLATYTLNVNAPSGTCSPVITPDILPDGFVGTSYSQTFQASGGGSSNTGFTFSQVSGTLPPGLTLSPTGDLGGVPVMPGTFNFVVQAIDGEGCSGTKNYTIAIANATPFCPTITLAPPSLPNAITGVPYSQNITASGGISPYNFTVVTGTLPTGLTLGLDGMLTGIPSSQGLFTFTIQAEDSSGLPQPRANRRANRRLLAAATGGCVGTQIYMVNVVCPLITINPPALPNATIGVTYSQTLTASGVTPPYDFTITGTLPPGLALTSRSTTSITFSGTPTTPGTFNFTVEAQESDIVPNTPSVTPLESNGGCSVTQPYSITVACPTITITPGALLPGTIGIAYGQPLGATGGTAPYSFALIGTPSLPPGLILDPKGFINGIPTSSGTFVFNLQVTDSLGCSNNRLYAITITCSTITLAPPTLLNGQVGTAYSQTLTANGGAPPYTFLVASGNTSLPPGLSLSPNGAITGTPTTAGNFNFTIQVTDMTGCSARRDYTIVVCGTITIAPPTLPNATVGTPYNQTLQASGGGSPPYIFASVSSQLPPGLTLSASGVISGTPTTSGSFNFTVQATNNTVCIPGAQTYTLIVNVPCPTITINPPTLPTGLVGIPYNQMLGVVGGTVPYIFSIATGATGLGLNLSPSGLISGSPTNPGSISFTVQATDANGCTGVQAYTITVGNCPSITITPAVLFPGTVGVAYNQTLGAVGGTAPYRFTSLSASTGSTLPPGLTLASSGDISGTPSLPGVFLFNVQVVDSIGCSTSRAYAIGITCSTITLSPPSLPSVTINNSYSQQLTATGGVAPYSFLLGGDLPPGLIFDTTSGTISGKPTKVGAFSFVIGVTDSLGCDTKQAYTINVIDCPILTFSLTNLPAATTGTVYSQAIAVSGSIAPYTFMVTSGALPPGLALQSASASTTILGTPLLPGTFNFTLSAFDKNNCGGTQTYTIVVGQSCGTITIAPNTLPDASINATYNQALTASGGTSPYTFSLLSGSLPDGLTLNQAGALSGAASSGGTFNFIVQAKDANNCTANKNYSLTINGTPGTIGLSASSLNVTEGGRATITITRTGGSSGQVSVNYTTASGSAVSGREFTNAQGTITFADNDISPKTFTVQTAANGLVEANKSFTLQLTNPTGGAKLGTASATVTIVEKDVAQPGSLAFTQPAYLTTETGGSVNITVVRLNGGNIPVSVNYETSPGPNAIPGSNYLDTRGTLRFTPGVNMQSFAIPILNDNQFGSNKVVNIRLSNPTGGATISTGFATLTIQEISANPAQLKIDLQDIDFGAVNIGNIVKRTITVTNTGGQELTFNPTVSGSGIKLLSVPTTRLLASQSTTFDMLFESLPGSLGNVAGLLNITSNGGNAAIKILGKSIDTTPPKMTFNSPSGGDIAGSGTQVKIRFDVVENDALSDTTVSFTAVLPDGKVLTGDIARLDGQSREATWNVPIDLETSGAKIFLRSSDRASNVTTLPSGRFSIRRSISTAPVLETLISFTPPPTGSLAAPSGLTADAKESKDSTSNVAPEPVLSVQINFQPPIAGQVAPPQNVTVKASELNDKGFAQIAKTKLGIMPRAEGDLVIAGYNVYRVPQNEDGSMPSADEIIKEENLVTTLPANATGFNDKVSTTGSNNFVYSVSTFFGNGQMSGGSQPTGTNLPVIQNPVFIKGTVFLDSASSFIKQDASLVINGTETYTLQFDETGTRFTVGKRQPSAGSSLTIKRLISKTSIVKMVVKNPDGATSVTVMFSRKGVIKAIANNVTTVNTKIDNIEPKADVPPVAGYNIYRVAQPTNGTTPKPEDIIKPENLIGSIPGNMTTFMDKASTSGSSNFTYSISTFFGNGQMSSGSQPASTDLPVVRNPRFEDKNFFVDSASSFIKRGATLIIDDKEAYTLEFDDSGTRFTTRKNVGTPSNVTIDQFIKKGSTVRLTIKNPDGKLSVGIMFNKGK